MIKLCFWCRSFFKVSSTINFFVRGLTWKSVPMNCLASLLPTMQASPFASLWDLRRQWSGKVMKQRNAIRFMKNGGGVDFYNKLIAVVEIAMHFNLMITKSGLKEIIPIWCEKWTVFLHKTILKFSASSLRPSRLLRSKYCTCWKIKSKNILRQCLFCLM